MPTAEREYDFLVIGGGIAGLTFALEAAKHGTVAVLCKRGVAESSTSRAQGGIAAVVEPTDTTTMHHEDTVVAGAGLCNEETVARVVGEGPARVAELIERGAQFDKTDGVAYDLHLEGGHSHRRIYHTADATGFEIQRALIAAVSKHARITQIPFANAIDLVTSHDLADVASDEPNQVLGAYVLLKDGAIVTFRASKTLVATGGAGKVYLYTSNPGVASGDGIAMCYRAGVSVANMEFIQFHPTCLYHPEAGSFLISEALRGEGAVLKTIGGTQFMEKYHEQKELAPRDIVARAIDAEMKRLGDDHVLLDITHRGATFLMEHFPTIYKRCKELGIDITTDPIPVVPAAHYCCGGVVCDEFGHTSVSNLYVAGEVAHTGLHGANRLASNSLLEGLVYGYRAGVHASEHLGKIDRVSIPAWKTGEAIESDEAVVITHNWDEIRRCMWNYVGIVRSDKRLKRALRRMEAIEAEIQEYYWQYTVTSELLELRNLCLVAKLVVQSALARKESRGLHFSIDYPEARTEYLFDTVLEPDAQFDLVCS